MKTSSFVHLLSVVVMDLTDFAFLFHCPSYSRARVIVLYVFEAIGLSRQDYGLYSLRAGGASAAANAQVTDRLFKRHGR